MNHMRRTYRWDVFAFKERGATHVRSELPNQDNYFFRQFDDSTLPIILAVADGHGSPKCFRSHLGSQFAVEAAIEVGGDFIKGLEKQPHSRVKSEADQRLAKRIIGRWQKRVEQDRRDSPFTTQELETLEAAEGVSARETIEKNPSHAYGSTLLAVFVTEDYLLFFKLGDGEIIVAGDTTVSVFRPFAKETAFIANETASLCLGDDARKHARIEFKVLRDNSPEMILLSTDGFPNAMPNDAAFDRFSVELLQMLRTSGVAAVSQEMPGWLQRATSEGSGDDVTVGIIFRSVMPDCLAEATTDQCPDDLADEESPQVAATADAPIDFPSHSQENNTPCGGAAPSVECGRVVVEPECVVGTASAATVDSPSTSPGPSADSRDEHGAMANERTLATVSSSISSQM